MKRIHEIVAEARKRFPGDHFFSDFESSCETNPAKKRCYRTYNDALMLLDSASWDILKHKALRHYQDHRCGRKQGFFTQLNEAFAYRYLIKKGHKEARFLEEDGNTRPDIQFTVRSIPNYCEVKTVCLSNAEISQRKTIAVADSSQYAKLNDGFLQKLKDDIEKARAQIAALAPTPGLIYMIIHFDDLTLDHYHVYKKQLVAFANRHTFRDVVLKIDLHGNKRIDLTRIADPLKNSSFKESGPN